MFQVSLIASCWSRQMSCHNSTRALHRNIETTSYRYSSARHIELIVCTYVVNRGPVFRAYSRGLLLKPDKTSSYIANRPNNLIVVFCLANMLTDLSFRREFIRSDKLLRRSPSRRNRHTRLLRKITLSQRNSKFNQLFIVNLISRIFPNLIGYRSDEIIGVEHAALNFRNERFVYSYFCKMQNATNFEKFAEIGEQY